MFEENTSTEYFEKSIYCVIEYIPPLPQNLVPPSNTYLLCNPHANNKFVLSYCIWGTDWIVKMCVSFDSLFMNLWVGNGLWSGTITTAIVHYTIYSYM